MNREEYANFISIEMKNLMKFLEEFDIDECIRNNLDPNKMRLSPKDFATVALISLAGLSSNRILFKLQVESVIRCFEATGLTKPLDKGAEEAVEDALKDIKDS